MIADFVLFYPFDRTFMVYALITACVVGACAPLIGTFVVQKRLSLIGDGMGHVGAAGVGIALWLNFAPQLIAIIATVIAAIAIEWIFHASKNSDTALALIFYSGIAASITFAGQSSRQSQLQQYLFGSLLSISKNDVIIITIVCLIIAAIILALRKLLFAIAIDEHSAGIAGIQVHLLHIILMVCVALLVSISMTITGLLLISAVMVVPVMSSRAVSKTFSATFFYGSVFGIIGSVLGLGSARILDSPPGGTIVLCHIGIYCLVILFKYLFGAHGLFRQNDALHRPQSQSIVEQK